MATTKGQAPVTRARLGRPDQQFEVRRNVVIDAAANLFAEKGFHGTSIADICKATEMGKGVLYHYISSKDEILVEIHRRFIDPLLLEGERILARNPRPDVGLREFGLMFLKLVSESSAQVIVFLHEWKAIRQESDAWLEVRAKRARYAGMHTELLRKGVEQGIFRADLDLGVTTLAIIGMHNYTYQWYRTAGRLSVEEIAAEYDKIVLQGICAR